MADAILSKSEITGMVESYMDKAGGGKVSSTQEILDSGAIPRLKGYTVRPGKVSDSIYGGRVNYAKDGTVVDTVNPELNTEDGTPLRIMVRTARISTHDINRGVIPFKDQILAVNHNYIRRLVGSVIGTSQLEVDGLKDSAVVIAAENLKQVSFENVLRAYMAKSSTSTSLYQCFMKGGRDFCGHTLPDDLITNGKLPYVMDTPSTKSDEHDESLPAQELIERGIVGAEQYSEIRNNSLVSFGMVSQFLKEKGLIFVDTKLEHGINSKGKIVSQDEIFTMDSSRFWLLEDYESQLAALENGEITELAPKSYSKEFARGFSKGEEGYTEEQQAQIAMRYIDGIQHLLGMRFSPDLDSRDDRVIKGLETVVGSLVN